MSKDYETKEVRDWEKRGLIPAKVGAPTVAPDSQPEQETPTTPPPEEVSEEVSDDDAQV